MKQDAKSRSEERYASGRAGRRGVSIRRGARGSRLCLAPHRFQSTTSISFLTYIIFVLFP